MADNDFGRGNENPQFHVKSKRGWFFSPQKKERTNIFQGHHANPNNIVDRGPDADPISDRSIVARLFAGLKSVGYDQADPDRNRIWLPTSDEDALRLGVAKHDTSHATYDRFMELKYLEMGRRADERIAGIAELRDSALNYWRWAVSS
jgi:A nuclease family of the HNH/ENDO VII superfamily with conserved AHH